ncbi:MAG: pilus assembly protein TadG-related protein, partial [Gemmatimonadales bacterium]
MSLTDDTTAPDGERGAILPLMAIVLIVLMGAAGMAVDLGWLFWQSIEIQHGADSAALAGVVYEPDRQVEAYAEALASAAENGYVDGSQGTTVIAVDFKDDETAVVRDSMLRVSITHRVPTFFMKVFGIDDVNISRTAVAEFVQPLALGSPESYFGDDPARGLSPGFWAQINGSFVAEDGGDR